VELPPGVRGTLRLGGKVQHIEGIITF